MFGRTIRGIILIPDIHTQQINEDQVNRLALPEIVEKLPCQARVAHPGMPVRDHSRYLGHTGGQALHLFKNADDFSVQLPG